MSCFDENNQHIGKLVVFDRTQVTDEEDAVTRWCPRCGACVVDHEVDGRVVGHYTKMRFPDITKRALKNG